MTVIDKLWKKADGLIQGDVFAAPGMRGAYATDASVYQEIPHAVATPIDASDVATLLAFCREHGVSIIGRGGGTSLSGQAIGAGLIIDFSRHMNGLENINSEEMTATVQPGIVLDDLNAELSRFGLHFAPDPATGSRATIGGMIGNNACGTRSIVFGRTCDSIILLNCLLADGTQLQTTWLDQGQWRRALQAADRVGTLYRGVSDLINNNRDLIAQRIPRLPRIAAGYSLQLFLDESKPKSLSDLICGSEGTLALVTEATLRLRPLPRSTALVVTEFPSIDQSLESLPAILECKPSAVELLDEVLINEAVRNAASRDLAKTIVASTPVPNCVLMVEFFGETESAAVAAASHYMDKVSKIGFQTSHRLLTSASAQKQAWDVRRLALGLVSNLPGKAKAIALIEDACLPIAKLPEYNRFVFAIGKEMGLGISTYAHASVGVLHYKVMLDLHETRDRKRMRSMAEACFAKCLELGGVFSGEHGDGIVRGEFLPQQFGPEIYDAFVQLKQLFDPVGLLNPGRKINSPPLDGPLRYGNGEEARAKYVNAVHQAKSHYRFAEQDGLVGAIEQCNGVGACRQNLKGTMCPSYRATRDERDSTRGRANLLRLAISGQLDPPGLANPELHQALDLCLACKACKSECPNAVDLARLKSEALQARWSSHGVSRGAAFVGAIPQRIARLAQASRLLRQAAVFSGTRWLLSRIYGIDRRRALPLPAGESFDTWLARSRGQGLASSLSNRDYLSPDRADGEKAAPLGEVVLFVDTWNRFIEPEVGIAVYELLQSCGYGVIVSRNFDGLRTRLSVGLLDEAKRLAGPLFNELSIYTDRGIPIVFIEPSEASAICDDLPDLVNDQEQADHVAQNSKLLDDFLADQIACGQIRLAPHLAENSNRFVVHPHCHQRALFRENATVDVLKAAGFEAELSDWGCCGMAGAFGYTHFDVSRQVSELKFAPGVRRASANRQVVVATGTSCRQQARDFCDIRACHWAKFVRGVV